MLKVIGRRLTKVCVEFAAKITIFTVGFYNEEKLKPVWLFIVWLRKRRQNNK